jgi:hypothetical protein
MATFKNKLLGQGAIGAGYSTLYTCPASKQAKLRAADIANTVGGTVGAYVHVVAPGASADASNAIIFNVDVATKSVLSYTGGQVLEAGWTIQVKGSGAGLTITASGAEISTQGR